MHALSIEITITAPPYHVIRYCLMSPPAGRSPLVSEYGLAAGNLLPNPSVNPRQISRLPAGGLCGKKGLQGTSHHLLILSGLSIATLSIQDSFPVISRNPLAEVLHGLIVVIEVSVGQPLVCIEFLEL